LDNIRDWCISRQLWWGHRIPVYYCKRCDNIVLAQESPEKCEKCNGLEWRQDEDVLDTWFSSWLWPFSTLDWPEKTADLQYFYPTDLLVTAPDIIFFWVARMIIAGMEFMDEIPFKDVYLNGIVRDHIGRKMSKSLGNGIDPVEIVDKYSADAMRYTLIMLGSEGQDINLAESHFEMGRNFSNKVWNSFRFLAINLDQPNDNYEQFKDNYQLLDCWILSRLQKTIKGVQENLENFRINDSLTTVYHFFWHEFCDWYLELIKPRFAEDANPVDKEAAISISVHVLKTCMNLLHPYIPFITEEIWQRLKNSSERSIVVSPWPVAKIEFVNDDGEARMTFLQNVITAIRNIRSAMNVPLGSWAELKFKSEDVKKSELMFNHADYIHQLARIKQIDQISKSEKMSAAAFSVVEGVELFVPLSGLIDLDIERKRLGKEIERLEQQVSGLQKKLKNQQFLAKAPESVVHQERDKLVNFKEKLNKLKANFKQIN
jgi:valyl-tRNA synthetase